MKSGGTPEERGGTGVGVRSRDVGTLLYRTSLGFNLCVAPSDHIALDFGTNKQRLSSETENNFKSKVEVKKVTKSYVLRWTKVQTEWGQSWTKVQNKRASAK